MDGVPQRGRARVGARSTTPSLRGHRALLPAGYIGNLVSSWIPALDGVVAKLEAGAKVADVGCGLGASTILMAKAFPKSTLLGFDYHQAVDRARAPSARRKRASPIA